MTNINRKLHYHAADGGLWVITGTFNPAEGWSAYEDGNEENGTTFSTTIEGLMEEIDDRVLGDFEEQVDRHHEISRIMSGDRLVAAGVISAHAGGGHYIKDLVVELKRDGKYHWEMSSRDHGVEDTMNRAMYAARFRAEYRAEQNGD